MQRSIVGSERKGNEVPHSLDEARTLLEGEESIALDLETTGLSAWSDNIAVITLYGRDRKNAVVLHYPRGHKVPIKVLRWLAEFKEITTHNGTMFDILFLANAGMDWKKPKWYDTLIGELAVITSSRRNVRVNLQDSLKRRIGKEIDKDINHESWGNPLLDKKQMDYLMGDISHLLDLRDEQFSRAAGQPDMLRNLDFEMALIPAVVQMELNGLPISMPSFNQFLKGQEEVLKAKKLELNALFGKEILLTSPVQLKRQLQAMFGEDTFPSTAAEVLDEYKYFGGQIGLVCNTLLEYRAASTRSKLYGVNEDPKKRKKTEFRDSIIDHDGFGKTRLHGRFWQLGTETGRFTSSQPNLQQIPKDMRHVFAEIPGRTVGATDYSGIEVRVAASLADDQVMIGVFTRGEDIHREVASAGFDIPVSEVTDDQRQIAKAMSFTLLFGGGAETFMNYAKANGSVISFEMAELAVHRFFERFEGLRAMRESANWKAKNLRAVPLVYPTGLKRVLFDDTLRASVILNNIVQGTAAAGLKMGLLRCHKAGLSEYISAVVHDEIVYSSLDHEILEVRDGIEVCMIEGMLEALEGSTPIPVAVESHHGPSWKEIKSTSHERVGGAGFAI